MHPQDGNSQDNVDDKRVHQISECTTPTTPSRKSLNCINGGPISAIFSAASKSASHGRALSPFAFDPFFSGLSGFRPGVDSPAVAGLLVASALVFSVVARASGCRKGLESSGAAEAASPSAACLTSILCFMPM